jgi:hypothetical protein
MDRGYLVPTDYNPHYHDLRTPLSHYVSLQFSRRNAPLTKGQGYEQGTQRAYYTAEDHSRAGSPVCLRRALELFGLILSDSSCIPYP